MSTLTHLSDAELDEVTGGFLNHLKINVAVVDQAQENVNVLTALEGVHQVGVQTAIVTQIA
jgi:hypothetical protein